MFSPDFYFVCVYFFILLTSRSYLAETKMRFRKSHKVYPVVLFHSCEIYCSVFVKLLSLFSAGTWENGEHTAACLHENFDCTGTVMSKCHTILSKSIFSAKFLYKPRLKEKFRSWRLKNHIWKSLNPYSLSPD